MDFIISQRQSMKPGTKMWARFVASLLAYGLIFATPFYPLGDLIQKTVSDPIQQNLNDLFQRFVIGSLTAIIIVLMVGMLIRGSGILTRGFALLLLCPAVWFFSLLIYELSPVGNSRSKAEAHELLMESISIFKFNGSQSEIRRLIRKSSSLGYIGCARYLDGNSLGFVFTNQEAKTFLVFVPNPGWAEGIRIEGGVKVQRILIVGRQEFSEDETSELRMGSRAEAKVMRLVRSALQGKLEAERREDVFLLLEILAERSFDWTCIGYRGDTPLPRAKGREAN
jgi:hypothetical protein